MKIRRASSLIAGLCLGAVLLPGGPEAPPAALAQGNPAEQPPFGGEPVPGLEKPDSLRRAPPGYALSARDAIAIASGTDTAREEEGESPAMRPVAFTRRPGHWQVSWFAEGVEVAQVVIDDRTGEVVEAWRDHQVEVKLARGYEGAVARVVNAPWIWLPLSLLFLAPFFDPRRPLRLLHFDLIVLLGFGFSHFFFNRGEITLSVPLVYPFLGYLFARMAWIGFRPRPGSGPLIPYMPVAWLAAAALALVAFRVAVNVIDSNVIDIGLAGVVGADRIADGEELYEGIFAPGIDLRGDVYGPANYLAYLPFEQLLPWSGTWDGVPAAHAAALAFDLLTALALFALGPRLRPGAEGRALGVALGFAWLAFPYSLYALGANSNDSLVALCLVGAMLALTSPPARGAAVAIGAAVKFGPLALAPLFATATGERRLHAVLGFSIGFALAAAVLVLPFLPDGGLREFYDRTFGYQATRGSPFSVWGLAPSLDFARTAARVFAIAFAIVVALVPRRKAPAQIAALGAAVIIATQVGAIHWFYFYVVWFAPFALIALFTGHSTVRAISDDPHRAAS